MKSGYVAVIGKTNAGKSTLINKFLGFKLNIVSPKVQTTRVNVLGILTESESQIVFIDTPGIHRAKTMLDKFMNKSYRAASEGADLILYLVDGAKEISGEEIQNIKNLTAKFEKVIVGVSKIDLASQKKLLENLSLLNGVGACEIVPFSSKSGKNVEVLKKLIVDNLPERSFLFSGEEVSNRSVLFFCAEIVREKVLSTINEEIPHGAFCEVVSHSESQNLFEISVDIICEKESHKAIIIGKGGEKLKQIGSRARADIERLVGKKVMLKLFVKVEKDWRNKQNFLTTNIYS